MTIFIATNVPFYELLLRWETAYVCDNLRTEKEAICGKYSDLKTSNWHAI